MKCGFSYDQNKKYLEIEKDKEITVNNNLILLTLYHTIQTFNDPKVERLWKTLWEKEKMLVTSSFSHNVFYSIKKRNHHFSNI